MTADEKIPGCPDLNRTPGDEGLSETRAMIEHEQWQGKPAVLDFRDIDASFGQGNQGRVSAPEQMSFDDLIELIERPAVADVSHEHYLSLPKTAREAKATGADPRINQGSLKTGDEFVLFGSCRGGKRDDAHLLGRSALTLDYDQKDSRALMRAIKLEKFAPPFAFVWHTTRSHDVSLLRETNQPKLRLIVPLARDVDAAEFEHLTDALDAWINQTVTVTLDIASRKPAQMMYCPIHNRGAVYLSGYWEGDGYLDPDWMLAQAPVVKAAAAGAVVKANRLTPQAAADGGALVGAEPRLAGYGYDEVQDLLDGIDPDLPYDDWMKVLAGVHHQMRGADEGIDLLDDWSARGEKYVSRDDVASHYRSFSSAQGRRLVTLKSIIQLRNQTLKAENKAALMKLLDDIDNCASEDELNDLKQHARQMDLSESLTLARVVKTINTRERALTGGAFTPVADLRKQLRPKPAAGVLATAGGARGGLTHEHTEFGNADRLADAYGDRLTYVPQLDRWYEWRGYWQQTTVARIEAYAQSVLRHMGEEADGMPDALAQAHYEWTKLSRTGRMVKNMVALLATRPGATLVDADELDADPNLLGVRNGVLNLRTGEFSDARRDDMITLVASVEYDPRAKCPLFEKVVREALNDDPAMVEWFQRLMGYTIMANPKEQFMVIPYGSGSNGKGTILNAIREVLGSHAKNAKAETFMDTGKSTDGPNESVLRLKGSRFVYMSEPSAGAAFNTGLVKTVTGGDALTARGPYGKQSIEFVPTWVIVMPTNHKPIIKDSDDGIWRRMKLIPFERKFTGEQKDMDLPEKLKREYPGILNWLVAGAAAYQRVGLGEEPRLVSEAHGAYRQDMDVLHDWLEDCWEVDRNSVVQSSAVFSSWQRWCERNNPTFKSSNKWLTRELHQRGFESRRRNSGTFIFGLKAKTEQNGRDAASEGFETRKPLLE